VKETPHHPRTLKNDDELDQYSPLHRQQVSPLAQPLVLQLALLQAPKLALPQAVPQKAHWDCPAARSPRLFCDQPRRLLCHH
jgi:hypothetical protein